MEVAISANDSIGGGGKLLDITTKVNGLNTASAIISYITYFHRLRVSNGLRGKVWPVARHINDGTC